MMLSARWNPSGFSSQRLIYRQWSSKVEADAFSLFDGRERQQL